MRRFLLVLLLTFFLGFPVTGFAYTFSDNFNDGDLAGWTEKAGSWSNPGDYLLSSTLNYGILWKDDSFGFDQYLEVDAYFDDGSTSKTAQLILRSGDAGSGPNPFWDHGYLAGISDGQVSIQNNVAAYNQQVLGSTAISLDANTWYTIAFSVNGTGSDTNLKLWVNDILYLDVYDTTGSQHDDGGYIALGSSNHLNRTINYDNISGSVDVAPVPEPATILLLGSGIFGLTGIRKRFMKR